MPVYVEIAVNVPQVSGGFHYHLPPGLEDRLKVGQLVEVPFGQQRVQGVVLRFIDEPEVDETKAVTAIIDAAAVVTPSQIELAKEISQQTLAPLAASMGLMLPVGLSQQADVLYSLTDTPIEGELNDLQQRIVQALHKRGPLRGRQLDHALPRRNWRAAATALIKQGILSRQPVLPPPSVRAKYVRTAQLSIPPESLPEVIADFPTAWRTKERRQAILVFLAREAEPVDVAWVYAETDGKIEDLRQLAERGWVMLREEEVIRDPLYGLAYDPSEAPQLTKDQQAVWGAIEAGFENGSPKPFLLHGVTGSGKTEIYLSAVEAAIEQGKQAIVLVPEIALTPQTVRRFMARFPGRVGLMHSRLSPGERYDTWRRARAGQLSVIVGPRSALFAPLPNIGLIVVDESHDDSYYQSLQPPYYHARQAAMAYAALLNAVCILGTATPDVDTYYQAQSGKLKLLELPRRILAHEETVKAHIKDAPVRLRYAQAEGKAQATDLPPVDIVDMREELKAGNRSIFSRQLQESLEGVLDAGQQAILFLNRRGSATYVFCRDCGHVLRSPRSDVPMTYHDGQKRLVDHHTGYTRQLPDKCPNCGSSRIRQYGTGTERVEAEVQALFPKARTLRWDHDTTRQKGAHDIILSHFSNQRADILVGTQMLAKGLDLPLVTLVGVVLADVGMHLPDYRAGERVFQVLAQVAGRAGRSALGGQVVLQSFHPEHYVIQHAASHDYAGFYEEELAYRKQLAYPPYTQLLRLEYRHNNENNAEKEAMRLGAQIKDWLYKDERRATQMIGPAPCFYTKLDGQYRWQIILRGPNPASLLAGRKLGDWRVEVNPPALL
ncbi:MAG: primosomal protein N' [Chloroflexi bacterium]|nr:MAG: primosomal protein N' [Chloroflexota bacterium]MBL1192815.1 primosomal protein N' [Chloroflexota bacterium]NOH10108.1 primosomal protein N' [Chloroflexota bacterium]